MIVIWILQILLTLEISFSGVAGEYVTLGDFDYYLDVDNVYNWEEAGDLCASIGMSRIAFRNNTEDNCADCVYNMLLDMGPEFSEKFLWTSGTRDSVSNIWSFHSGLVIRAGDEHWGPNQPDGDMDDSYCLNFAAKKAMWEDDKCDSFFLHVMCEKRRTQ